MVSITIEETSHNSSKEDISSKEDVSSSKPESVTVIETVDQEEPYTVFSKNMLIRLLAITSFTGMISPLTGSIYFPAINKIEAELDISTEQVNLIITVYMVLQATSPTFWGTIADSWGRRPVLLVTMVIYCASCIGLALTPNYAVLMVLRMVQAFGSSSLIAISAGILSDIVQSRKRGSFYGIYSIGQSLGPILGPVLGGIISEKLGWRWIFWVLLILGCVCLFIVGFFVPETLRVLVGNGSGYANPTPSQWLKKHGSKELDQDKKLKHPKMNFLAPFTYLLEPDVFLILWLNGMVFTVFYCIMTSTTKQFSIYYPYLSELEIGACFLSMGLGTVIGGFTKGKLLDRDYLKTSCEAEFSIYTARLQNIWFHLIAMQVATCIYGWMIQIGAPLPAALAIQFVFAFSSSGVTSTCQTLLVDLFPGSGASITASNNLMRCILGAAATAYIEPAIQGVGMGWIFTILGICLFISNICVPILLQKGSQWNKRRFERQGIKHVGLFSCCRRG
ncbi:hypothetical protein HPULCUR_005253 [Helicostylum pulchrum]|uniref:Major facilitator superfamily (MFS) profile domain-containing protein n=1 Tax=Helicostylum pulchrum TaxID=562976 RepID=A0ABP9XYI2_9FUNG